MDERRNEPCIWEQTLSDWRGYLVKAAAHENVWCKISGLLTEADWQYWTPADFRPYLDVVVEAFGTRRILYGSDWPVCTLAGSYESAYGLVADYFINFSPTEQNDFFGQNAVRFYRL